MENNKKLILKGVRASAGVVSGKVQIIRSVSDIEKTTEENILVVSDNNPIYATALMKSRGLICENGGLLSHLCIIAAELKLPCLTSAKGAIGKLSDNDYITLDCNEETIYEG